MLLMLFALTFVPVHHGGFPDHYLVTVHEDALFAPVQEPPIHHRPVGAAHVPDVIEGLLLFAENFRVFSANAFEREAQGRGAEPPDRERLLPREGDVDRLGLDPQLQAGA